MNAIEGRKSTTFRSQIRCHVFRKSREGKDKVTRDFEIGTIGISTSQLRGSTGSNDQGVALVAASIS